MPGVYTVGSRGAEMGRAGLALPFPPTKGPLVLADTRDLRKYKMSEPASGNVSTFPAPGVWTEGVSECSVIAIVEWTATPAGWGWGRFFFEHILSSDVGRYMSGDPFSALGASGPNCFAVVGQWYGDAAFRSADELFDKLRIPTWRRSYYRSGYSGMSFGLRFHGGAFGEINPWRG